MSKPRPKYDVSQVVAQFLANKFPERRELVHEITDAMRDNIVVQNLLVEIGQNAVKNRMMPVDCIGLGVMYGMVLGILLEKEYRERGKMVVT